MHVAIQMRWFQTHFLLNRFAFVLGMAAKYAYSNPIYRRGIIASIPSHPEHESNRQVEYSNNRSNRYFPNAPSHRRIRDPTSFKHRWASQKSYVAEQPMKSRSLAPLNQPRPPFAGRKKPSYVYENFYSDELADSHGFPEYQHYETLGVEQYQTSEHLLPPPYQGQPYRGIPRRQENHVLPRMNNQDYFHESYENFPPHAAGENYDIPPFQRRVERKTGLDLNKIKKPRDIDPLPSNFERHAPAPRLPHRAGLDISKIKSSWDTKPDPPFLSNRASLPKQINENSDYTTTQHGFGVSQGQRMYQRDTQYVSHSANTKHQFLPESSDFDIDAYYHDNDFAAESYISNGNQVNRSSDNLKSDSNVPEPTAGTSGDFLLECPPMPLSRTRMCRIYLPPTSATILCPHPVSVLLRQMTSSAQWLNASLLLALRIARSDLLGPSPIKAKI